MSDLAYSVEVAWVQSSLSRAWWFLSGERSTFNYTPGPVGVLPFAEFSYFMPLTLATQTQRGGVGVFMQRGDAVEVAAYMFGVSRDQVDDADLRDACAEVCNVLSDCITLQFGAEQDVKMGLPLCGSATDYVFVAENSVSGAVYQESTGARSLLIVLYDSLILPN